MLFQPFQQGAHAAGGESDVSIRRTVIQMDRVAFGLADIFADVRALTQHTNSGLPPHRLVWGKCELQCHTPSDHWAPRLTVIWCASFPSTR